MSLFISFALIVLPTFFYYHCNIGLVVVIMLCLCDFNTLREMLCSVLLPAVNVFVNSWKCFYQHAVACSVKSVSDAICSWSQCCGLNCRMWTAVRGGGQKLVYLWNVVTLAHWSTVWHSILLHGNSKSSKWSQWMLMALCRYLSFRYFKAWDAYCWGWWSCGVGICLYGGLWMTVPTHLPDSTTLMQPLPHYYSHLFTLLLWYMVGSHWGVLQHTRGLWNF